ncbi:hypothetical protein, partial [Frankia sp. Cj3]|uniref:hypothetical protein n=1 Tax=Frankia sp. Cj3 TaxID=2880976 RepID=UPI001EF745E7
MAQPPLGGGQAQQTLPARPADDHLSPADRAMATVNSPGTTVAGRRQPGGLRATGNRDAAS